jgi:hypothetical protein
MDFYSIGMIGAEIIGQPIWEVNIPITPGNHTKAVNGLTFVLDPTNPYYTHKQFTITGGAMIGREATT